MATAKKLPSGSWRCQVYSHTETILQSDGTTKQKRIYKSFTCNDPSPRGKRQVEKEAAAWAAGKENGTSNSLTTLTFGQALDAYISLRSAVLSPATVREYKRSRKADLQGLMQVKLSKITQEMIQAEINKEALSHSPKSVRNMHGLLSAVMGAYRPDFNIHTKLPEKVRPNLYVPSDEDVKKLLLAVSGTEMEIPVLLAAFGPMRRGEICALNADHVKGNIVHVEYSMVLNDQKKWVIKQPKSFAGNRYIEFPDFVIAKLPKSGMVVSITPAQISDHFANILKKNDIPKFRFHDLRHYSASIQHALGIPDAYIMQRGGWGNDSVLKTVYRHAMSQKIQEMSEKINGHFNEICNTKYNTKLKKP